MNKNLIIFFFGLLIIGFLPLMNLIEANLLFKGFYFILLEVIFFISINILFFKLCVKYSGKNIALLLASLFNLLFLIIFVIQSYAFYLANNYLTVLAFENQTELRFLNKSEIVITFSLIIILFFLHYSFIKKISNSLKLKSILMAISLIISFLYIHNLVKYEIDDYKIGYHESSSPVVSFIKTYKKYLDIKDYIKRNDEENFYPYIKSGLELKNIPNDLGNDKPNVIVVFVEGLSRKVIANTHNKAIDVMPNLSKFESNNANFTGYFNHSAATYRGLIGQLVSGFIYIGGVDNNISFTSQTKYQKFNRNYSSIPKILDKFNYNTYFLSPHNKKNNLNNVIKSIGFDYVFYKEYIEEHLLTKNKTEIDKENSFVLDSNIFKALDKFIKNYNEENPFFIAVYNIGTHAFTPLQTFGKKYPKNPTNNVLNRFYNFDYAFGSFIDSFFASKLKDNTILIVTSDHASYPEPEYDRVFNSSENYYPFFVDEIPLIVYSPYHQLRDTYNVNSRTSIDFAPTLFNLC